MRVVAIALSFGLVLLWVGGLSHEAAPWLTWLDLAAGLIAFVSAVRAGGVPAVTGDEGVASLEIAIRCLETPAKPAAASAGKRPRRVAG